MNSLNSDIEVLTQAIDWLNEGSRVELITVARTWGSSPRPPGSLAAVREDGHLVGSVSGGCIEKQLAVRIDEDDRAKIFAHTISTCLLYTSPSPRDATLSRMPSSA